MRILVFGAGSLGSLLAGFLARRNEVHVVGRDAHVAAIRRDGLRIHGLEEIRPRVEPHTGPPEGPPFDMIIVAVKSYDTQAAAAAIRGSVGPGTLLVTIQNGLGNLEILERAFPSHPVLAAPTYYGAVLEKGGEVHFTSRGHVLVGARGIDPSVLRRVAEEWARCGIQAAVTEDVEAALWLKVIVNASINPLTAIHRVKNGVLYTDPGLREQMRRICLEGMEVARRAGIRLPSKDLVAEVERVARDTGENRSSMLQSVERGRPTEIDAINGAILREGRRLGVPCPANQAVYDAIRELSP